MTDFKKGGPLQNSNIYATNRLFVKNPLFKKRKKKRAPGVYNPKAKFKYEDGGENKTKLTKEEEKQFQKFYKTLPENLQSDDNTYDIRGYWDGLGRPQEFDYTQPKESDGYYHAFSINPNTGEYLKSPAHDTFQHAVDEDRKIGYRPLTNVYGRNVAVKNESIADPEAQTFLRNTQGPVSYKNGGSIIDLTEEEIQKYIDGGYVVEEVNDPSIPALNRFDNGGDTKPGVQNLQEATIYDPKTKKEQLSLFQQLRTAKEAYQNYTKQNKGKKWTLNAADPLSSSISDLKKQIQLYKDEFKKEKEETERELKRLESLKNRSAFKNNKDIQNLTLKDLSTVKGKAKLLDAARSSNLSGDELFAIYKGWGLDQADYNIKKGTGPGADYSAKEARQNWGDSDQWNKFTGLVSNAATAIPLLGAAGALSGAAGSTLKGINQVLSNPYIATPLTAYGLYDATTNTLPEAYKDFSEGRYWEGLGNTALAGLDLVPGVGLAGKGAKLGYKGLGKAINYAKNLEPSAPGPMMLGFNFLNKTKNLDNVDDLKLIDTEAQTLKDRIRAQIKPEDPSFINMGTAEDPMYRANTRGRSMDYDQTVGMLEEMTGKMPILEEAGFPMYLHGSTSASLPGIIKSGGIEPLGYILNRGEVPFTGELSSGVKGINKGSTSTAYIRTPESALSYALNQSGKGRANAEANLNKWFTQKRANYKPGPFEPEAEFYDDLHNKRLTQWQSLSKEEQSLLDENFPVMFGIRPKTATTATNDNRFVRPKSDIDDEIAISGKIGMDEIPSMFVPKNYVETVQKLLGDQSKVLPMEQFVKNQINPIKQEKVNQRWQDLGFSLEKYGGNIHKQGRVTDDYIEVDIPEEEIQWYIDNGYRVEPVTKLKKFIG